MINTMYRYSFATVSLIHLKIVVLQHVQRYYNKTLLRLAHTTTDMFSGEQHSVVIS